MSERERYELECAKMRAKGGLNASLSQSAVDVLFEQAWDDRAQCGGFTMRLLVGEIYRLRSLLRTHKIEPETGFKCRDDDDANGGPAHA